MDDEEDDYGFEEQDEDIDEDADDDLFDKKSSNKKGKKEKASIYADYEEFANLLE